MGQLYTAPFPPGTCVTLAAPEEGRLQPMDAVVLEYVTRDYIYAYTVAAYWRQVHTQPGWRILTRVEAHRLSRADSSAPTRRGQVCRRLYWAEGGTPRWGEAVVLAEVRVANTGAPVYSVLGDGAPSRVLLDIAWRTAEGEAWVVEKRVNPTALLPVKPMPRRPLA